MPKNPHADFSPVLKGYSGQSPFKFWCQLALPLTYDDSLSYYELLNKVVSYLNNTISDVANVKDNVGSLLTSFTQLQDYVNAYFDELDIEQELKNILDEMALDGSLDALLNPIVVTAVGDWLENNLTPTTPPVDSTLSIEGAAADSKTVGEQFAKTNNEIKTSGILESVEWVEGRIATDGGNVTTGNALNSIRSSMIPVDNSKSLFVYAPVTPEGADSISVYIARYAGDLTSSFIDWTILDTRDGNYIVTPVGEETKNIKISVRARVGASLDAVDIPLTWHDNVYVMYDNGAIPALRNFQDIKIETTVSAMKSDSTLIKDKYVKTLGFNSVGDNGDAFYEIDSLRQDTEANNCTVIALDNGYYAYRIFLGNTATLESMNFPTKSISAINTLFESNGIKNVKCGNLETPYVIVLGDYDFEFDTITYTGSNYAIVYSDFSNHSIIGNAINSPAGSGLYLDSDNDSVRDNVIEIKEINVKYDGIVIHPTNHHGIVYNKYIVGRIIAGRRGIYTYFSSGADGNIKYYAWEAEEVFSIGNIKANSSGYDDITRDGVAVEYNIPDDNNHAEYGTITGIDFLNLAVEGSTIGIKMRCGTIKNSATSGARAVAGIKSVMVYNMRAREPDETDIFLDISGFIWDVYIKPTSPIKMNQWLINATARRSGVFVDAPIFTTDSTAPIGYGLWGKRGMRYIDKPVDNFLTVTGNVDYAVIATDPSNASGLWITKYFILDPTLSGESVSIEMPYNYGETARDILIRVPKANNDTPTQVVVTFQTGAESTIANTDSDYDHLYSLSCFTDRLSPYDEVHILRDLGTIGD